jgi:hypothetical protein
MSLLCHLSYVTLLLFYFERGETVSRATIDPDLSTHLPSTIALDLVHRSWPQGTQQHLVAHYAILHHSPLLRAFYFESSFL